MPSLSAFLCITWPAQIRTLIIFTNILGIVNEEGGIIAEKVFINKLSTLEMLISAWKLLGQYSALPYGDAS